MSDTITNYFYYLMNPFIAHRKRRLMREGHGVEGEIAPLSYTESITMSWFFVMMEAFVILFFIHLAKTTEMYVMRKFFGLESIFSSVKLIADSWYIIGAVLSVVFYPLFSYFYILLCRSVLKICLELFNHEMENKEEVVDEVISSSFVSSPLLMFPIFGKFFKNIALTIYLYAGLRENLLLSKKQSLLVILTPFILISSSFVFTLAMFVLLLKSFGL